MLLTQLLTSDETEVRNIIIKTLNNCNIRHKVTNDYIITTRYKQAPLICVHTDTVGTLPPFLNLGKVVSARDSECLGADDRAGVWIALQMIINGTRTKFEYGFFVGEEKGCVGSRRLGSLSKYTCFIGLDRAARGGIQNIATYGYDNAELISFFPYEEQIGTYTDCSVLAKKAGVACVNVSVGYDNEHSPYETLNVELMKETLELMSDIDIEDKFYYQEQTMEKVVCDYCGKHLPLYYRDYGMLCSECVEIIEEVWI